MVTDNCVHTGNLKVYDMSRYICKKVKRFIVTSIVWCGVYVCVCVCVCVCDVMYLDHFGTINNWSRCPWENYPAINSEADTTTIKPKLATHKLRT